MAVGWLGQYDDAKRYLAESLALARELGDRSLMSSALNHLGHITQDQRQFGEATVYLEESLELSRESGDRLGATVALFNLGAIAMQTGARREAVTYAQESLALAREVGSRSLISSGLSLLGLIACDQGAAGRRAAQPYLHEALTIALESRAAPFALYALFGFAKLRAREGQPIPAVELLGLVLNHPALIEGVRDLAEPLLAELEAGLPPPAVAAALDRGKAWTLEEAARLVLEAQPVAAG
jgi:tetratricopeptide (TPR) repeat protein